MKINSFYKENRIYPVHTLSCKVLKGTFLHQTCHHISIEGKLKLHLQSLYTELS